MTLIELRERTESWFAQLGIPSARLDAEVLIGHALSIQRLAFITDAQRPLTDDELAACRELVRRRGKREPIAYILGNREFYSRDFAVDPRVLVPRPETEHLVDLALDWLRRGRVRGEVVAELDAPVLVADETPQVAAPTPGVETTVEYEHVAPAPEGEVAVELDEPVIESGVETEVVTGAEPGAAAAAEAGTEVEPTAAADSTRPAAPAPSPDAGVVLDYGTGSGAIAVTLAAEQPGLRVLAIDISREALEVAKANADTLGVGDRVGFVPSDGLQRVPPRFRGALRAIVANPPYVPLESKDQLAPDVRDWEPSGALFAGDDALLHYRALAEQGRAWLAPGGFVAMEVGIGQAEPVADLLRAAGWRGVTTQRDLAGIPRVVAAWRD